MTHAPRTLAVVALVAVVLAAALVGSGALFFLAAGPGTPAASAPRASWTTRWPLDVSAGQLQSALPAGGAPAPPVLLGQTVYALGLDRRLHALDPRTGEERWAFGYRDARRIYAFRMTRSLLVLLVRQASPSTDLAASELVGVDPSTRGVLWDQVLDADVYLGSLQVTDDTAYLAVADNVDRGTYQRLLDHGQAPSLHPRVRAYAVADGARRWEQPLPERPVRPAVDDVEIAKTDRQVIAAERANGGPVGLASLEMATGEVLWHDPGTSGALGVAHGQLVTSAGSDLVLLNPASGQRSGRFAGLAPAAGAALTIDHDQLYWAGSRRVTAVDLVAGRRRWRTDLGGGPGGRAPAAARTRPPSVSGGQLYLGAQDRDLYAIDIRAGRIGWTLPLSPPATGPAYAPLRAGNLVLLQDDQLTAYQVP